MSLLWRSRGERRVMDASWFGTDTRNPNTVTPDTALRLTSVFAAIRHIVDFLSTLPLKGYRTNDDGSRASMPSLPLLFRNQNALGRPGVGQWIGQAAFGIATRGNAVGYVVETDGFGFPTVVRWVRGTEWAYDEQQAQWRIAGEPIPADRILHIPWIVPTGCVLGLSPIEHFAAMVSAGMSAQEYADVKRSGGIPPAHLKNVKKILNQQQATDMQSLAVRSFASGKPFVSGADWDLTLLSIPPNHVQFIETLKLSANSIASIYGIDPTEVGGEPPGSLTYANEEARDIHRARDLRPYMVRLEDAFARILPERQYVKFNVDSTIRTDIKTRTEVVGAQVADGRMNVDEARALEDRGPVPGGSFYNVPAPKAEPTTRTGETP